ncbi:oligoendopeptidase [Obelidium mucronatum]|nr:oligoendopeptidase [Obelidium mucronatum]
MTQLISTKTTTTTTVTGPNGTTKTTVIKTVTSTAASASGGSSDQSVSEFIDSFNLEYESKHKAFENNFWATKMNLAGNSSEDLARTKNELDQFLGSVENLEKVNGFLARPDLTADERKTLLIFQRTFKCYIITNPEGVTLREELNALEAKLAEDRRAMKLGYVNPENGEFVAASTVQLMTLIRSSENEALRKSCYEGLRSIGPFIAPQFIEIVNKRNKLARLLGFVDFYDYKVQAAEGFGKATLFPILETLVQRARPILDDTLEKLANEKGADALKPWNTSFALAGSLAKEKDPYFPFETAVNAWARSFAALGIKYEGATMQLDLCDRKGKYSNGFCHWPQPAWTSSKRGWVPSQANFTSLATPGQVGSGLNALVTLMHEGGHAAHFANVRQPSPLFSQERAPTSIPYAENQSMFLDSLVGDAAWLARYAYSKDGQVIPWELIEKEIQTMHTYKIFRLTALCSTVMYERKLYEVPEAELTPEALFALADATEIEVQGIMSGRPLLAVPHPLTDESAAYMHGYVMAEMAVFQTRKHFLKKYGTIVDNPQIGEDLKSVYWVPGNSRMFLDLVKEMTGEELSGDAWLEALRVPTEVKIASEKAAYFEALEKGPKFQPTENVDLDMRVILVHGDEVISDSSKLEGGLTQACDIFKTWIGQNFSS